MVDSLDDVKPSIFQLLNRPVALKRLPTTYEFFLAKSSPVTQVQVLDIWNSTSTLEEHLYWMVTFMFDHLLL